MKSTSPDELLKKYSVQRANGCVNWIGKRYAKHKRPTLFHESFPLGRKSVRAFVYERKTGHPIPKNVTLITSCMNDACIAGAHLLEVPRRARGVSRQLTAEQATQLRCADPKEFLEAAFAFKAALEKSLHRKGADRIADDVIQDVMLRAFIFWNSGKEISDLKSFLVTSVRRISIDYWRKEERAAAIPLTAVFESTDEESSEPVGLWNEDPAFIAEYEEEYERQTKILSERKAMMGKRTREAFEYRALGMSQQEISDRMEISENTVEGHLRQAYATVRSQKTEPQGLTALYQAPDFHEQTRVYS
jgi:RNA polymerase sigma factor (sigma-70 family)